MPVTKREKRKTVSVRVYLTPELKEELRDMAYDEQLTLSSYIVRILLDKVKKKRTPIPSSAIDH